MLFSRQKVKDGRRRKKFLKGGGIYDGPVWSVIYLIVYAVLLLSFHHIAFEECRTKKFLNVLPKNIFDLQVVKRMTSSGQDHVIHYTN